MQDEATLEKVGSNDPIIASFKKAQFRLVSPFVAVLGLIGLITGGLDFIMGKATFATNTTDDVLVFLGIALLLLAVLLFLLSVSLRGYWSSIQKARQNALHQPQHFLLEPQPVAINELPQPNGIQWKMKRNIQFLYFFMFYFVFSAILDYFINNPAFTIKHILITLITALLFATIMTAFSTLSTKRTGTQTVSITEAGITSRIAGIETFTKWEDARLFTCYRERILGLTRKAVQYELVSEQTIVRWGQPKTLRLLQVEPSMDQQQFERWHEQLRGYVVGRTGLPLVELKTDKKAL
jgi:hypothetical protein